MRQRSLLFLFVLPILAAVSLTGCGEEPDQTPVVSPLADDTYGQTVSATDKWRVDYDTHTTVEVDKDDVVHVFGQEYYVNQSRYFPAVKVSGSAKFQVYNCTNVKVASGTTATVYGCSLVKAEQGSTVKAYNCALVKASSRSTIEPHGNTKVEQIPPGVAMEPAR
jgi:hypothetical protein